MFLEELRNNHVALLVKVAVPYACWFLWQADHMEDFKWRLHFQFGVVSRRVVLREEVTFEGPNHVWRALNIAPNAPGCPRNLTSRELLLTRKCCHVGMAANVILCFLFHSWWELSTGLDGCNVNLGRWRSQSQPITVLRSPGVLDRCTSSLAGVIEGGNLWKGRKQWPAD